MSCAQVNEDGTTVWAVQAHTGGSIGSIYIDALAADNAGNFIGAGRLYNAPSPSFGGLKISPGGAEDAVLWKVIAPKDFPRSEISNQTTSKQMLCIQNTLMDSSRGADALCRDAFLGHR